MSYEAEAATIRTHFKAGWGETTPVAYENQTLKPPNGAPWVRLTILNGDAFQADMVPGATRHRHPGAVTVQVFTEHGTGDGKARRLGDTAAALFRGQTIGGIVFRTPTVRAVGSDRTWYQVNVTAEFFRDSIF